MRIELQPAYILHSRPFRDTSLIIDCLTRDFGRLSLIAKGARSAKSRQRQLCQPFGSLLLSWQGKSSLKTMISIESRQLPLNLRGDHLFSGFYLNELLTRVIPEEDSCQEVYHRYGLALEQLSRQEPLEPVLRSFELGLLEDLGYSVDLTYDAMGNPLSAAGLYQWRPEHGWTLVVHPEGPAMEAVSEPARSTASAVSNAFVGAHLLALSRQDFTPDTLRTAKTLSRLLFQPLLGSRPLESRKLFQKTLPLNTEAL
ncbi:DNA repair protein RecO [Aestuariicella hydrocarbonica]|uniref:DNA repair protein RecO n=1 Tax=Pseudomaricurvus hydrocarbonicus TaxID=1470433 RepID=A0A9E5MJR7_9GAMM|nr:DNA repair protein RecO [Aestuariicella hydrocarbonica]NHO65544.1 DNA repair protein RecO [Aestuariicella hydrocarbonica]